MGTKAPALSDLRRRRRLRPGMGVWGRSPKFPGRMGGNKDTCLIRPTPPEKTSARHGGLGAQPQVSRADGWEQRHLPYQTYAAREEPRPDSGGLGAQPPVFKGRAGGNQRTLPDQTHHNEEDLVHTRGSGGVAPGFRGGWAGNKKPYLIVPTPVRANLAKPNHRVSRGVRPLAGGLGAQPPVPGAGGRETKAPALSDLCRPEKTSARQGVWGRSPRFPMGGWLGVNAGLV